MKKLIAIAAAIMLLMTSAIAEFPADVDFMNVEAKPVQYSWIKETMHTYPYSAEEALCVYSENGFVDVYLFNTVTGERREVYSDPADDELWRQAIYDSTVMSGTFTEHDYANYEETIMALNGNMRAFFNWTLGSSMRIYQMEGDALLLFGNVGAFEFVYVNTRTGLVKPLPTCRLVDEDTYAIWDQAHDREHLTICDIDGTSVTLNVETPLEDDSAPTNMYFSNGYNICLTAKKEYDPWRDREATMVYAHFRKGYESEFEQSICLGSARDAGTAFEIVHQINGETALLQDYMQTPVIVHLDTGEVTSCVWNGETMRTCSVYEASEAMDQMGSREAEKITFLGMSDDGRYMMFVSLDGLYIWDTATNETRMLGTSADMQSVLLYVWTGDDIVIGRQGATVELIAK